MYIEIYTGLARQAV